jgi:hypothetical protein
MAKFMLLYRGDATPMEQIDEKQAVKINDLWTTWTGKHQSALVDVGTPFGGRASVGGDGSDQTPPALQGYTIVEAGSVEEAKAFADGHPFLDGTGADFTVDVFELVPIQM